MKGSGKPAMRLPLADANYAQRELKGIRSRHVPTKLGRALGRHSRDIKFDRRSVTQLAKA
ncbi:MAG: hypothetical protein WBW61_04175 [Rhodanobacteraceae bacterium]